MSALANPRHERFAQLLAQAMPASLAYVEAGFRADKHNACRLRRTPEVRARVAELLAQQDPPPLVTVAGVTERLLRIAETAEQAGTAPMLAIARAALTDAARLNGLGVPAKAAAAAPDHADVSPEPLTAEEAEAAWRAQVGAAHAEDPP